MKKFLVIISLLTMTLTLGAQNVISFGPKIGWNSSRLTTDYANYIHDIKSGCQGGFFFSIYLNKFYVQPEGYLSIKRGRLETSLSDPLNPAHSLMMSQTLSLKTIDLPLLVGYKLLDLKLVRLRVWGGPVASYIMDKDYTFTIDGVNHSDRITRQDFRDATWSVQLGAGLDVLMLTLDVGYEIGLNKLMSVESLDHFSLKNNVFYCSLGWRLF